MSSIKKIRETMNSKLDKWEAEVNAFQAQAGSGSRRAYAELLNNPPAEVEAPLGADDGLD